ncbi:MAG: ATP-binding protein [Paludibacteraceae bacterium]|nr:ATP-binding protein [Paludibacteraceae bacterium]
MEKNIIGRKNEKQLFNDIYESSDPEFVAVYGRRRIGKTFLIKEYFEGKFAFYITGMLDGSTQEQLRNFNKAINDYSDAYYPLVNNWLDAFDQLKHFLTSSKKQKLVVFIDELPWLDTPKSKFLRALDYFWNSWGSTCGRLKLIVCGSATTWMLNKLIGDKGGLHNRINRQICLQPFTLGETEKYLKSRNVIWNRYQTLECYMVFGGVPFYLSLLDGRLSFAANVDNLLFSANGQLRNELNFLFRSLFIDSQKYRKVIELLAKKNQGLTREEIKDSLKMAEGGNLSTILENLQMCSFIKKYSAYGKKERDFVYQLTDLFSLFYLKFVAGNTSQDEKYWQNYQDSASHKAWTGYAFEQVCLLHINQIKKKLGIEGVATNVHSWQVKTKLLADGTKQEGAQIDLLIDRADSIIDLCEMKYSNTQYTITESYAERLTNRRELFRETTKTKKALHLVLVTTYGIKRNAYSNVAQNEVTSEDLFG